MKHSRRTFLKQSATSCAISPFMVAPVAASLAEEDCSHRAIDLLQKMADNTYKALWSNLKGVTEKEADWKPNLESNSIRWIVGHLCWFEEWLADALENKGRYLTDKKPESISEANFNVLKTRFDTARMRSAKLISGLTEEQLQKEITYVGRMQVTIESLLQTHVLHMSGHRYQVRYVRGTHSRVFHTNKADFDPW